jgi:hypothetical protein
MTRKDTRNTRILRGTLPFTAVLSVMLALAALAQTSGADRESGTSHVMPVSPPLAQGSSLLAGGNTAAVRPSQSISVRGLGDRAPDTGNLVFVPAVIYSSGGGGAQSLAVADVNGDGIPDLAIANIYSSTVGILLGNSDGTFQTAVTYGDSGAVAVVLVDVNGDGKPDLVAANYDSGTVSVLLGNGDGTFQTAVAYDPGGTFPIWVAVADVNGDGKPDLVVANCGGGGCASSTAVVCVLLGNGDGTFQLGATYSLQGVYSVVVSDLNGDGKPDLVVAEQSNVAVMLGNGDGTFQSPVGYDPGGFDPESVVAGDVNGDGKPDLLVANLFVSNQDSQSDGVIGVLLGNGDGTFQPAVPYDSGGKAPSSIAVADLNGDGKPDLLVGNCSASGGGDGCTVGGLGAVGVLLGNGDGTFRPAFTYSSGGSFAGAVAIADVNADGKPDLLVANLCTNTCAVASGTVGVLLNGHATKTTLVSSLNPSVYGQVVTFTAKVTSGAGKPTGMVVFLDGPTALGSATLSNGRASISVSSLGASAHSIVASYQGAGTFAPSTSSPVKQVVKGATTITSLTSSQNPAVVTAFVTYTATVVGQYGGTATGTVLFQDGDTTIATVTLWQSNQAAYSTKYKKPGTHPITATYSGDPSNAGSVSSTLVEQINRGFLSKTVLTTSGSPSHVGQPVTFTATVTSSDGTIPDGELVTFFDRKIVIGTGTTASGVATFTTSALKVKTHVIKATYPGDAVFKPSSGWVTQVVEP